MTSVKAIANKTSIMLKIDMSFMNPSETVHQWGNKSDQNVMHLAGWYYVLEDGSEFEGIREFGIQYYTSDSSDVTEIPFDSTLFRYNDSKTLYSGEAYAFPLTCTSMESDSHTVWVKVRNTPNYPLMCLVKGLTEDTGYHIGCYYKDENENKTSLPYEVVYTKTSDGNGLVFNTPVISSAISDLYMSNATTLSTTLPDVLDEVAEMFNDATEVEHTYTPTIVSSPQNFAANSYMEFNCYNLSTELRSVVIHELQHNHFDPKNVASGGFTESINAIKFMEFATDCEGATWGRVQDHYYPIVSSQRYDYIDDYLVVMATDVDYLFSDDVLT